MLLTRPSLAFCLISLTFNLMPSSFVLMGFCIFAPSVLGSLDFGASLHCFLLHIVDCDHSRISSPFIIAFPFVPAFNAEFGRLIASYHEKVILQHLVNSFPRHLPLEGSCHSLASGAGQLVHSCYEFIYDQVLGRVIFQLWRLDNGQTPRSWDARVCLGRSFYVHDTTVATFLGNICVRTLASHEKSDCRCWDTA